MPEDTPKPADFVDHNYDADLESADEIHESGGADCSDESDIASTGPTSGDHADNKANSRAYHSWSKEESALLETLVREHGCYRKWTLIAKHLPGRTGKQCRDRWNNHLRPGLKQGSWSAEEDYVLAYWHSKRGGSWAAIAFWLPGRTAVAIKNHWNAVNKLSEKGGKDTVLTTYVGLLRTGLSRDEAYSQAVKKIGLPAEWSAVLDQTLEASKYDNQASLLPPKWEEILCSNTDAKRPNSHRAPANYTDQQNSRLAEPSACDTRHAILHPFAAAHKSTINCPLPTSSRPSILPKTTPFANIAHASLRKPEPNSVLLERSDCSSPSSGSSETEHSMLTKPSFDQLPPSLFPSLPRPISRSSSPSTAPCETPTAFPSCDYGLPFSGASSVDLRADVRSASFYSQRHVPRTPTYSSAAHFDFPRQSDYAHPSDYMYNHQSSSWNLPADCQYERDYRLDRDLEPPQPSYARSQYHHPSNYPSHHSSHIRSSSAGSLYTPPVDEYDQHFPYPDDLLDQLLIQQSAMLAEELGPLTPYSLQPEQLRLDHLRKQLREQILNERKRRFSQAFSDLDVPIQSPRACWSSQYSQMPAPAFSAHRDCVNLDLLETALKHEPMP